MVVGIGGGGGGPPPGGGGAALPGRGGGGGAALPGRGGGIGGAFGAGDVGVDLLSIADNGRGGAIVPKRREASCFAPPPT